MIDNDFKQKTKTIFDSIIARNCSPETRRGYSSCYNELGDYLSSRQIKYSADAANKWIQNSCGSLGKTAHELYAAALRKLEDLYSIGEIKPSHYTALTRKDFLSEKNRGFLSDYIQSLASSGRASETVKSHQAFATRLFLLQQQNGCSAFLDSSYTDLLWLYAQFNDKTYYTRSNFHTILNSLLESAYSKGWVPFGYTLFVKGMAMRKGYYWNNVSPDQISDLKARQADRRGLLSLSEYYALGADLLEEHRNSGYSANRIRTISRFIDLFYLFMDMNSLLYEPKVVENWLPSIKPAISFPEFSGCRRFFILIEQQYRNIPHDLSRYFFFRETLIGRLPQWARPAVDEFMDQKQAEGWKRSTLDMFRSSICRFCLFLDAKGIRNYKEITAPLVKQFNVEDPHATPEGKNAYNSRIRMFLEHLGENGALSNPFLFLALTSVAAPKETLVVTLTGAEQKELERMLRSDDGQISLRKKAMLQLGLHMGIRGIDIVNLIIDSIDWENASIRFMQAKTSYEVNLPMPDDVANALYRYIMQERPDSPERSVFLRKNAPFSPLVANACSNAPHIALPERNVPESGFHVLRKTFGTNLLKTGSDPQEVAEALGHQGMATVHRYMSADEDRMRSCCLSLAGRGLLLEGGFCHG